MVEEDAAELHVVLASPPSLFDAAVLLRTLYTGLGPRGWKLHLVGLGRRVPLKLVSESRTPVAVVKQAVVLDVLPQPGDSGVYVVDPRADQSVDDVEPPRVLLVDYSGMLRRAYGATPVRALGLPSLTYEAAVALYGLYIRRKVPPLPDGRRAYAEDVRAGLYLARKVLESITSFDNYTVLAPSVVVNTLRRVLLEKGYIVDAESYVLNISPVEGSLVEEIRLKLYNRRLEEQGYATVRFHEGIVEVKLGEKLLYRIEVDTARMRACVAQGLCAGSGREEPQWPVL